MSGSILCSVQRSCKHVLDPVLLAFSRSETKQWMQDRRGKRWRTSSVKFCPCSRTRAQRDRPPDVEAHGILGPARTVKLCGPQKGL